MWTKIGTLADMEAPAAYGRQIARLQLTRLSTTVEVTCLSVFGPGAARQ
jgi:hypothetical protein